MKILVACEESQVVCHAFRHWGHEAFSCDVVPCSGNRPEWHIMCDVLPLLNGRCSFMTLDGVWHHISGTWDMIIAHPPCTYLTAAGAVRLFNPDHSIKDWERYELGLQAADFFFKCLNADCPRVCVENPVPLKIFDLPGYSQIIEPFYFGEPWRKRTCLWLRGLPELRPTDIVKPLGLWVGSTSSRKDSSIYSRYSLSSNRSSKLRSKTFLGIARAMAEQWG